MDPQLEIQQLTANNEALLRNKAKMQQDIIDLKKQIEEQRKDKQEINRLILELANVKSENTELKDLISFLQAENKKLTQGIQHLREMKWYNKLLRRG